jgi:hypothetical protein
MNPKRSRIATENKKKAKSAKGKTVAHHEKKKKDITKRQTTQIHTSTSK